MDRLELIKLCLQDMNSKQYIYKDMDDYFRGNSKITKGYTKLDERSNRNIPLNYIKQFIKDEVAYTVGNPITYISEDDNEEALKILKNSFRHISEKHDQDLTKNALKFSVAYELQNWGSNSKVNLKICTPMNSYLYEDDYGNKELFIRKFKRMFIDDDFIEVYDSKSIEIYKITNGKYELLEIKKHFFGEVPVSKLILSEEGIDDTLYKDLKGLIDALECNVSDVSNEVSDTRSAILFSRKLDVSGEDEENKQSDIKGAGWVNSNNPEAHMEYVLKNLNDSFSSFVVKNLKEFIYEIAGHVNTSEKLSSNTSSLALQTRLITLVNKCEMITKSLHDCIKDRIRLLFKILKVKEGIDIDYTTIVPIFTFNTPSDDLITSQIVTQLKGLISDETARSQLSFVNNTKSEDEKVKKEIIEKAHLEAEVDVILNKDEEDFGNDEEVINGQEE